VLHGLVAICPAARKGGYNGSHRPKQWRASSPLGVLRGERSLGSPRTCATISKSRGMVARISDCGFRNPHSAIRNGLRAKPALSSYDSG